MDRFPIVILHCIWGWAICFQEVFLHGCLAAAEYVGEEKVFSTYASALEVMTDQFQPSGTDYIIHVLGDKPRQEYLETFCEWDFRYVTTIKETYDEWEYWVRNANCFFIGSFIKNTTRYGPIYISCFGKK